MLKKILLLLVLCVPALVSATSVPQKTLEEIVRDADHVIVATVIEVDVVDGLGRPLTGPKASTGPGSKNQMRFRLSVEEVLFTRGAKPPRRVIVPLWQMWHYRLDMMQAEVTGARGIFLLKGKDFQPAYHAGFQRSLDERAEIERLLRERTLDSSRHK